MLAILAALAVTEVAADEVRPDVDRVERMAAGAAERFEGCCRGHTFDRAARRAWLRKRQQADFHAYREALKRVELRELPEFEP